jgi:hypothetical protein
MPCKKKNAKYMNIGIRKEQGLGFLHTWTYENLYDSDK